MTKLALPLMLATGIMTSQRIAAQETETWTVLGTGTYQDAIMCNMYPSIVDNDPVQVRIEVSDSNPKRYRIVNPWAILIDEEHEHYMIIDASDPEMVVVPKQVSQMYDVPDGETWIASVSCIATEDWGYDKAQFLEEMDYCNITMQDDIITFPAGCAMFMWPDAVSGYSQPGEWMISNDEFKGYLALPGVEPPSDWKTIGTGRLCDGFVHTFFNKDPTPNIIDVEVQEHKELERYYRVIKPFTGIDPDCGDLYIDMYRPDFGFIEVQDIDMLDSNMGWAWILSVSSNGTYQTLEDFLADGKGDVNVTMENGRINIPAHSVLFYFPQYSQNSLYDNKYASDSYLELPATDSAPDITVTEDFPAEYFNLQGQRLAAPQPGQLIIVRQGNKCTKQIFK